MTSGAIKANYCDIITFFSRSRRVTRDVEGVRWYTFRARGQDRFVQRHEQYIIHLFILL